MVETIDPSGMVPTYTSRMYKVFDNVNVLWMDMWIHHHAVISKVVGPDFGSRLKSEVIAKLLKMPLCGG